MEGKIMELQDIINEAKFLPLPESKKDKKIKSLRKKRNIAIFLCILLFIINIMMLYFHI